jgi:hypothetical protein
MTRSVGVARERSVTGGERSREQSSVLRRRLQAPVPDRRVRLDRSVKAILGMVRRLAPRGEQRRNAICSIWSCAGITYVTGDRDSLVRHDE